MLYDPLLTLPDWCIEHSPDWLELSVESEGIDFSIHLDKVDYRQEVEQLKKQGRDPVTQQGSLASKRYNYHMKCYTQHKDTISSMAAEMQVMYMRANLINIELDGVLYYPNRVTKDGLTLELANFTPGDRSRLLHHRTSLD